jgi:hypothetical protein
MEDKLQFAAISAGGVVAFLLLLLALYIIGRVIAAGVMRSIEEARKATPPAPVTISTKENNRGL